MNTQLYILKKLKIKFMQKKCKPIIIVAGESKSVFLEIFFKSLKKKYSSPIILIVNKDILKSQLKLFKYNYKLNELSKTPKVNINLLKKDSINFINIVFNRKDENKYISNSFSFALKLLKINKNLRLINGPITKKKFLKNKFKGITEYLASKTNNTNKVAMLIFNKKLSVSPITTHIPLKYVHKNISKKKIINHTRLINSFYVKNFHKKPSIAITGLNPHCESNFNSSEEDRIIKPAINFLKKKKYKVSGPYPADTVFLNEQTKKFDVIIGMYHDQVLGPLKSIYGFNAINITLGLPFTRISPDHGPNSKMFGKNISNPNSLIEAINFLENKCS